MMADSSPDSCLKGGRFCAPGFRFHPTDEELVVYYLKRKICGRRLRINVIGVVDVYKWDPEELPGQSLLKSGDRQWFFFTPRSRKYPNGARSSRGTVHGYWKATGKDRNIVYNSRTVGIKKTLVFYRGRAPNGERTDWVMHEYTMDEEELSKCQNAKDYYALYKLYKKSGAGPKNGEQYGAPFQEEEWADDDDKEETDYGAEPVPLAVESNGAAFVDDGVLTRDDIEELLRGIADAPEVPPRQINNLPHAFHQVNSEEDIQSTLMNTTSGEIFVPEQIEEFMPSSQPYDRHLSLDSLVSANSFEATDVTSTPPRTMEVAPLVFEKDDFIEMDDLLIPDLDDSAIEQPLQPFNTDGLVDGLSEFDLLFHDVAMSFDMDPVSQGTAPNPSSMKEHHPHHEFQQQTPQCEVNYLSDPNAVAPNQYSGVLWLQAERGDPLDEQQYYSEAFASPSSGVISGSTNPPTAASAQDPGGQNCPGKTTTRSQFSSALWSLMESIPSTPASACEGPPLDRTFVRMSSFSRIRFTAKANGTSSVSNHTAAVAKKSRRNRGFLLLYILGALCAILGMFMATVRISERSIP
ncbi:PREDICTED: NAC domain-containing protein 17-like [Tarenaya hassleriana]|uniref:NAC domain-containing protein 17-like n=1 Tax=Tarenaya hassleriana TaxID=28532 RepID=UPI00053C6D0A|nr:PREDICTED: NAC domain-containing protein 17-like [Tarenaya hassleriana]XP_010543159.1 PREDICTED: NAC domain-containing protein 17-like [Tarenaya hassleriana]